MINIVNIISGGVRTGYSVGAQVANKKTQKKIKTNIDSLNEGLNQFDKAIEEYSKAQWLLVKIYQTTDEAWEGKAADTYKEKLRGFVKSIGNSTQAMYKIRKIAAERMDKLEAKSKTANQITNIFKSISPF